MSQTRFDGGVVTHRYRYDGCYNTYVSTADIKHWYNVQWVMLVKRLRYGGRRARGTRERILRHWGETGLCAAMDTVPDKVFRKAFNAVLEKYGSDFEALARYDRDGVLED